MNPNSTATNGEQAAAEVAGAAGAANETSSRTANSARDRAARAARAARERADDAQQWARSRWGDLQRNVESQPYQTSAWALGIGFAAGMLVMGLLLRGRR